MTEKRQKIHKYAKTRSWLKAELEALGIGWRRTKKNEFGVEVQVHVKDKELQKLLERQGYVFGAEDKQRKGAKTR